MKTDTKYLLEGLFGLIGFVVIIHLLLGWWGSIIVGSAPFLPLFPDVKGGLIAAGYAGNQRSGSHSSSNETHNWGD